MTPDAVQAALHLWPGLEGGSATLINLSENHTFRVDTPDGHHHILRVHRPGYHNRATIESELAWLKALAEQTDLKTVTPIPGVDGQLLQQVMDRESGARRFAVRFAFEPGVEPNADEPLEPLFAELGRMAATCHTHVETWQPPAGFTRPSWTPETMLSPGGLWGDWRVAPGVTAEVAALLERASARLHADFAAYGATSDRFGLIHADMRLANVLVHDGQARLIDFDDCGFGWFIYDFGAAVSFFETDPRVETLKQVWVDAYRRIRTLTAADEQMLDAAVLLRRMVLLAWIGSHAEVELAQSLAPHFATGTVELAERYLRKSSTD